MAKIKRKFGNFSEILDGFEFGDDRAYEQLEEGFADQIISDINYEIKGTAKKYIDTHGKFEKAANARAGFFANYVMSEMSNVCFDSNGMLELSFGSSDIFTVDLVAVTKSTISNHKSDIENLVGDERERVKRGLQEALDKMQESAKLIKSMIESIG